MQTIESLWEASSERLRAWFERQTGDAHGAEDLVQETFTRIQENLGSLRDGDRLAAWVGAIASNVLADHGRRMARSAIASEAVDENLLERDAGDREPDLLHAAAGWIEAFLARLDPTDVAFLRAVDLEGRAQVDIARELGLAPSSARSRVQRARARLRKHLEACCNFVFDARGNLTETRRRSTPDCGCDPAGQEPRSRPCDSQP